MIKVDENGKVEGRIEFDILVDGKYQKRVSKGILLEDKGIGCEMCMCGSHATIFNAIMSLEKHIDEAGLREEFETYRRIFKSDDIMGSLDAFRELLEKIK